MSLDDIASRALEQAKTINEFKHHYRRLTHMRSIKPPDSFSRNPGTLNSCPACGQGLKKRVAPGLEETILLCPGCNWFTKVDFAMDEAVDGVEPYLPGITKQHTPTVVMDATGKIKRVMP